ncbi:MAG TPA: preprotein translocase subunit SecE [Acidimicrobiales bacterium]|nr:preprotein translocase subunit SecE [Acidimicrobiales bacterium]
MAVNRQTKRLMQRQGQMGPDGEPTATREPKARPAPRPQKERLTPAEYIRQVRAELRKVAWPTKAEVINYSIVVFVALAVLTALIFGLDYVFGKAVIWLFK